MKRWLLRLILALTALAVVLGVNTWRSAPEVAAVEAFLPEVDRDALAQRLGEAIAIPTLSPTSAAPQLDAFHALHRWLEAHYPQVHASLTREIVGPASLLYHWRGRERCAPVLLAAHQDVVPVEPGTEVNWQHPPFSGLRVGDVIWGRGALDDKASLLGLLEAVEHLLARDFVPRCDVWFAFGHDEEVGGEGARAMAALLASRGVAPEFVLDEGGALTRGAFTATTLPLATIGVAEKGYMSVRLTARARGGHSSMPPARTAIGALAAAVAKLESQRPAAELGPVQRELLRRVAPHVPLGQRVALSNLWLTAPLVKRLLATTPASDATLRTTTAPTLFQAGIKDNVLPQQAEAVVNFRIRPGDSSAAVLEHVRDTINDTSIDVAPLAGFVTEPTAPAPWDDDAFRAIERALRAVSPEPELIVAPYVTSGATDARHYAALTPKLYRFAPVLLTPELLDTLHGTDERIALDEYVRLVRFYLALLRER